ncbi:MAG: ribonuclease Z [Flavobacterium sp.]|nr:ribonuclease Z [Candidatus Neoflavobacterium equi]
MTIVLEGNAYIFSIANLDVTSFLNEVKANYSTHLDHNIIVDFQEENIDFDVLELFSDLAAQHIAMRKSFVFVVKDVDYNEAPDHLNIAPTLQEAFDIIQMEDIERDLGF